MFSDGVFLKTFPSTFLIFLFREKILSFEFFFFFWLGAHISAQYCQTQVLKDLEPFWSYEGPKPKFPVKDLLPNVSQVRGMLSHGGMLKFCSGTFLIFFFWKINNWVSKFFFLICYAHPARKLSFTAKITFWASFAQKKFEKLFFFSFFSFCFYKNSYGTGQVLL